MTADHRRCDVLEVAVEESIAKRDWDEAEEQFDRFAFRLKRHLQIEEEELFPVFEQTSGSVQGPTSVMRIEHDQMREMLDRLKHNLLEHDDESYAGNSETLHILMMQHNLKEEQILYPAFDRNFAKDATEMLERIRALLG